MSVDVILSAIACLFAASLVALLSGRARFGTSLVYGICFVVCFFIAGESLTTLLNGVKEASTYELPVGLPLFHSHFRMDLLSTFFLLVINLLGGLASLFGIEYGHHEKEPIRVLPFYPIFIAGMNLVVISDDAFSFLVAWELMSLASWFLVLSTHKEKTTPYAAYVYLVMASVSTIALFVVFMLLAGSGSDYTFAAMRANHLTAFTSNLVLLFVILGAGSKAGIVPLHVWLPLAHPAAPSHVSALMSGVMTKVAIYAIIRILFDLIGPLQWWWGGVLLILGGVTALMGVLYAVMQHDLKRLLAYSTVENIGIIIIGISLALAFRANGFPMLAALSLTAALFHVLNHALFKSLLFLGSGAVLTATGHRDMEHMGGLIHRMPVTAFTFLIGSAAISALPPFNGFVSEWLTFQAILNGVQLPQWALKFATPVVGAMLALAAALAAVCFVKVFGIVFLGRARSQVVAEAREVGSLMLLPMIVLTALCALIGILPFGVLVLLRPVVTSMIPDVAMPLANTNWHLLIPFGADGSSYSGLTVLVAVAIFASLLAVCIHQFASNKVRRGAAWDCGFPDQPPETQYTASSFAQPIRRVFGTSIFSARDHVDMPRPGETRAAHFKVTLRDPVWDGIYAPVSKFVMWIADILNATRFFSIRRYLVMIFITLIFLLIIAAIMQ